MELEFLWKLAHQLDKETFMEVHSLIDNTIEIGENNNLYDLLEKKRKSGLMSMDEFSQKFGVAKQAYNQWKSKGNIPNHHIRKSAEILGISNKEAESLNFRKDYSGSNTNSIKLLEKRRIELGMNKKEFSQLLGCDMVTYRYWRKVGKIPENKIKSVSEATEINFDLLMESNFVD